MSGFIDKIINLPTPSSVLQRITMVIADRDSSVNDIVDALKMDPGTTGRILKLANSAYVGMPRAVSSLHNAVVLLGTKRIHSLVLSSELLSPFKLDSSLPFTINNFWKHSITVALAAESMAKHLRRYAAIDTEEVFSAAILHDIGRLVVGGFEPDIFRTAFNRSVKEKIPLYKAEEPGTAHTTVGDMLAAHWNFPPELRSAIAAHHTPATQTDFAELVSIVHVADVIAHVLGYGTISGEAIPEFDPLALSLIQLPAERLRVIAGTALENEKKIEALVELIG